MLHPSNLLARANLRSICALIATQHSVFFRVSHQPWNAYMQLLPGLITKIDLVTVFASERLQGRLLQNCVRNHLRRTRNPKGSIHPYPPRMHSCSPFQPICNLPFQQPAYGPASNLLPKPSNSVSACNLTNVTDFRCHFLVPNT